MQSWCAVVGGGCCIRPSTSLTPIPLPSSPRSIFGTPLVASRDTGYTPAATTAASALAINTKTNDVKALVAELHASVEQGDAEAVRKVLSSRCQQHPGEEVEDAGEDADGDSAQTGETRPKSLLVPVDSACPRTGMSPLLKAVEGGSAEVIRVLLDAGADVRMQASVKWCASVMPRLVRLPLFARSARRAAMTNIVQRFGSFRMNARSCSTRCGGGGGVWHDRFTFRSSQTTPSVPTRKHEILA